MIRRLICKNHKRDEEFLLYPSHVSFQLQTMYAELKRYAEEYPESKDDVISLANELLRLSCTADSIINKEIAGSVRIDGV